MDRLALVKHNAVSQQSAFIVSLFIAELNNFIFKSLVHKIGQITYVGKVT